MLRYHAGGDRLGWFGCGGWAGRKLCDNTRGGGRVHTVGESTQESLKGSMVDIR